MESKRGGNQPCISYEHHNEHLHYVKQREDPHTVQDSLKSVLNEYDATILNTTRLNISLTISPTNNDKPNRSVEESRDMQKVDKLSGSAPAGLITAEIDLPITPLMSYDEDVCRVEMHEDYQVLDKILELRHLSLAEDETDTIEDHVNLHSSPPSSDGTDSWARERDGVRIVDSPIEHAHIPLTTLEAPSLRSDLKLSRKPVVFKSIERPLYPIAMSSSGPRPFSLEAQKGIMRWKYLQDDDAEPYWIMQPDLQQIKETIKPALSLLKLDADGAKISWLAEGAWHKVYTVSTTGVDTGSITELVLRLALPVYPYFKVESDVATTEIVRHFTNIPVPIVYCYDSSANNSMLLEWMLME